jgi:outer membrane protein OmpA-like peptidoglycan-associated protein
LFQPLVDRAGIVQFEKSSTDLDAADLDLLDRVFSDQRGASWFLVVARASPEGSELFNRDLSQKRAQAVLDHLTTTFQDPDLAREVGLLWLGEEYAQLEQHFCSWPRSGSGESCTSAELNRSAFVAWIDCRI